MSLPPFATPVDELHALQEKQIAMTAEIRNLCTFGNHARHVDKLRIMRGQCCTYIAKMIEICDGINR